MNGKQKAYVVCQDSLPAANDAELSALEGDLKGKKAALDELVRAAKAAEAEVKQYSSKPRTSAVRARFILYQQLQEIPRNGSMLIGL